MPSMTAKRRPLAWEIEQVSAVQKEEDRDIEEEGSSGADEDSDGGREHYLDVGESRLQKNQDLGLGPKYSGSRVTRSDLDGARVSNNSLEDDVSDNAGTEAGDMSHSEYTDNFPDADIDAETEDELDDDIESRGDDDVRQEAKRLLLEEQKDMVQSMAIVEKADAEKGEQVKDQMQFYDRLLECRIKMQKSVAEANALPIGDSRSDISSEQKAVCERSLSLAQELFESITKLREQMMDTDGIARAGSKRKATKEIQPCWQMLEQLNMNFFTWRDATLDKWSAKVNIGTAAALNKKFKAINQSASTQVQDSLVDMDRLVQRTRQSRYTLPTSDSFVPKESEIFDDTDFYQQLLKDLVDTRMVDSKNDPSTTRWAMGVAKKQKRHDIDTKASKGRKVRYHVHEKLQNFMAPLEDALWHEEQIDELFAGLLGQRITIAGDEEAHQEIDRDELRLFS